MNRFRLALLPVPFAAAIVLAQCGMGSDLATQKPSLDAAADTRPVVRDARPDQGFEEFDAGIPETEPGWRWFSALGTSCRQYSTPIDPKAQLPALAWQPCAASPYGNGTTACAEWDVSTWSLPKTSLQGRADVSSDGRYLYSTRVRAYTDTLYDAEEDVYDRTTFQPLGALRFRVTGRNGAAGNAAAICQLATKVRGFSEPIIFAFTPKFAFVGGTPAQLMDKTAMQPLAPDFPKKDIAQDINASNTTLAFTSFGGVIRVKRSDMSWVRANRYVLEPLVVGDDVLASETTALGWIGMTRVESDGAVTAIRAPANKHVSGAAYDGNFVYWTEQFGSTPGIEQPHLELWRSVYTRDIVAFNTNAERIVALDGSFAFGPGIVHNGVYTTARWVTTLVIRVSDKQSRLLNVAPGVTQSFPFYADQNDIWVRFEGKTALETHYAKVTIDW
jgi:hypothetical protein